MKVLCKWYFILVFCLIITSVNAADTAICDGGRCVNTETNNIFGWSVSFKPVYKNQYELGLLKISDSCENDKSTTTTLPKNSFFKQTLDNEAQNANDILVHVYETDVIKTNGNSTDTNEKNTIETFFKSPFKVCLNGKHRVPKSLYKRVGGVSTGLLVVPFKFRSGDVYSDSAIGPYVSYKWDVVEILATAGISQISVSQIGSEEIETETGLTAAFGINFEIDTNWDIAFLVGVDHLSGDKGDNWKYQDKAWFSFGIGFNFTR